MKVYITKYALTDGIYTAEVEESGISETMVVEKNKGPIRTYHKPHWHPTEEAAIRRAEKMRDSKIKSLERSLVRMKHLKFEL